MTVDLLTIEIRERGAILHWRARSERDVLLQPHVSVSDQGGTPYRVIQGGGGGGNGSWEGQTLVVPRPPEGSHLNITIDSFGPQRDLPLPPHLPTDRVVGPWTYSVELSSRDIGAR